MLGGPAVLVGAHKGDFLADVLVEELGGLEEVVFVVLLDDAEFLWVGEGAEMHGGRIYGGGDIHQFEAKGATGKRELADVAHEGNIGVVDGDVEIGLVVQAGRLIRTSGTWSVLFLSGVDAVAATGRIEQRTGSHEERCR